MTVTMTRKMMSNVMITLIMDSMDSESRVGMFCYAQSFLELTDLRC